MYIASFFEYMHQVMKNIWPLMYNYSLQTHDVMIKSSIFYYFIFNSCSQRQGSILFTGQWSTDGCTTTFTSNSTICHCNHLTHFAILLSAQPLVNDVVLSQTQVLALQITGYIGVSLSLVAMAATSFVFVFLK